MNKEEIMECFDFYIDRNNGARKEILNSSYKYIDEVVDKILVLFLKEKAELEAKVYTYEKIIANSNFAPILKESKKEEE